MKALRIWLVRPHPPRAVLAGRQPVAEESRHTWEPIAAKLLAQRLTQRLGDQVEPSVWHLFDTSEDEAFVAACAAARPDVVAFSEIDLLVNQVSRLAWRVKRRSPHTVTVVGGKQTSLLQPGDRFPFVAIDHALAGDGVAPLVALCAALLSGSRPADLSGRVHVDERGLVDRVEPLGPRDDLVGIDGPALHEAASCNHPLSGYLEREQRFPAPLPPPYRTAVVLFGTGCRHGCAFCQSPVEYRNDSATVLRREPADVADEIAWLAGERAADAVFALSPNMELEHVAAVYRELAARGLAGLPIAGFVRAADVVAAERRGLLEELVAAGLRVLSVGLDAGYGGAEERLDKRFDQATVDEALEACRQRGVAVAATVIATPELPARELAASLEPLCALPLLSVDVRLATALRNTPYFRAMERFLLRHPDRTTAYFDRQSYRYQTLVVPGGARPRETYRVVADFAARFARHEARRRAAALLESPRPASGAARHAGVRVAGGQDCSVRAAGAASGAARDPGERRATGGDERPCAGPPEAADDEAAYDRVAARYARVFADVRVRRAEWRWLERHLPAGRELAVLDLGCGPGALLRAIAGRVGRGLGIDVSAEMIAAAQAARPSLEKLRFARGDGAHTSLPDASFDLIVSCLSLHYLDGDGATAEVMRLLVSGGRFLCVDMVASPVRPAELPRFAVDRAAVIVQHLTHPGFAAGLRALVREPAWQAMERRYPLLPLERYEQLAARLGARLEVLSVGAAAKVVAFAAVKDAGAGQMRPGVERSADHVAAAVPGGRSCVSAAAAVKVEP